MSASSIDANSLDQLFAVADTIVAKAKPGEQIEVVVARGRETEVKVYQGEIEAFTSATSQGYGVRIIADQRQGFAYAGSLDADSFDEVVAEARDNATFGTVDEHLGLAEPDGLPIVDLGLFSDSVAAFPDDRKIELAKELEELAVAGDPRIIGSESSEYNDSIGESVIATNTGIRVSSRDSGAYLYVGLLAEDDGETQTGFGLSLGREPADLDLQEAATQAVERTTRLLGATKPASQRTTVVLDPYVSSQFLGIIGGTLSGGAVMTGRSLFAERMNEQVAASGLTLIDDPTDIRSLSASESDGEGLATRRNVLIDNGKLNTFVNNTYTGRRLGTTSTGSAVRGISSTPSVGCTALQLLPGARKQAELLADIEDGILIQGVSGLHSGVNAVSGDFSTGAKGLRIRNGELAEPVREFTIASTLQRMLLDVVEVGGDIEWLPWGAAGVSLVVSDVSVSGT